jgi:hypothetical protein
MAWETLLEFSILESMPASTKLERLVREEYWIQEMIAVGVVLYNSRLFPTQEPGAPQTVSAETRQKLSQLNKGKHYSPSTEFKKGLAPSRFGTEHTKKAKELIGASSKTMWADERTRSKLLSSRQSEEFRSFQSERMKTSWEATRDQRIQTLNLPEVRAQKSLSATDLWNDEQFRERMKRAQNSFASKLKRLVAAVGAETASKISCGEWLQGEVQEHGIKGTANRLNVDRGTIRRWHQYHKKQAAATTSEPEAI